MEKKSIPDIQTGNGNLWSIVFSLNHGSPKRSDNR